MAGLANFAFSPTDTQTVKSGAPASGARSSGPKFRLQDQSTTVFDAVLNNRQPAAEKRNPREAIDPGARNSSVSDRKPAPDPRPVSDRNTSANAAPAEKRDPPAPVDTPEPARNATAADDKLRSSKTGETESGRQTGTAEDGTEDGTASEIQITEFQVDPSISQVEDLPQQTPQSAGETEAKPDDTVLAPPAAVDDISDTTGEQPDENLKNTGQPDVVPVEIDTDIELAGDKAVPAEADVEDNAKVSSGPVTKDLPVETATRQTIPAGDTAVGNAKKGAGAVVPDADADGAAAKQDGASDDGDTPAPKTRTVDANAAKPDTATPKPATASFAADLAQTPRASATPGQIGPGSVAAAQIDAGGAVFRGSAASAKGAAPNLPIRAIALHIASKAADGLTKFQIRLDPPDLGRIDVKLEIARDGRVSAQLTVDRPETLDALLRDQRGLERTLQNAGLDTSEDGLNFSLRQDTEAGAGGNDSDGSGANRQNRELAGEADTPELDGPAQYIGLSAIDIRV